MVGTYLTDDRLVGAEKFKNLKSILLNFNAPERKESDTTGVSPEHIIMCVIIN